MRKNKQIRKENRKIELKNLRDLKLGTLKNKVKNQSDYWKTDTELRLLEECSSKGISNLNFQSTSSFLLVSPLKSWRKIHNRAVQTIFRGLNKFGRWISIFLDFMSRSNCAWTEKKTAQLKVKLPQLLDMRIQKRY